MIIVHAFHHYWPVVGGMERAVQFLAEMQSSLGHEVHVITSRFGARERPSTEIVNGVYVHRVPSRRLVYPDLTIPKVLPYDLIKNADVVHVHGHNSMFSQSALEAANRAGSKTVCYFMAVDSFKDHPNLLIRLLGPYYDSRNVKRALRRVDLPLVKNARDLDILRRKYGAEAVLLPDGIPSRYIQAAKTESEKFRAKYGIRHDEFFLFIGRIHKLKGPHVLVKAMKYLEHDVASVFIGPDGGYLKTVKALAEKLGVHDRFYYLGYVSEEDKIAAIDSAVALVVPSLSDYVEVYSIVISEAWAREKPVIATSVGGLPYRVKNRENGILVRPGDPKMLADAMRSLLIDRKQAESMGKKGKGEILTWEEIATKSITLYRHA